MKRKVIKYIIVSFLTGILFGIMDGLIHANPLARELFSAFSPVLRNSVSIKAGIIIDLVYGFVITGLFLILHQSIPGNSGWRKGLSYGLIIWIFRVLMHAVSLGMIFAVPFQIFLYILLTGLAEMLTIGFVCGISIKPEQ